MKKAFPYIEVPEHLRHIVGDPAPGTRMYRAYGKQEDIRKWFDTVMEISGEHGAVSPGGVTMYTGISRTGVHKRLKEGRLTIFLLYVTKEAGLLKKKTKIDNDGRPYGFIPLSECRAWADEIRERAKSDPIGAEKERVGDKSHDDSFLNVPKDWKDKTK